MRKKQVLENLAALRLKRDEDLKRLTLAATQGTEVKPDEVTALDQIEADIKKLEDELKAIEKLEERAKANVAAEGQRRPATVHNNAQDRSWGSFGEFLGAVVRAASPGGSADARLYQFAPTGAGEAVPADGGFLVGTEFSNTLLQRSYDLAAVASRCRRMPVGAGFNRISWPYVDETSRVAGSRWGGVRVYRAAEADTVTAAKPKFGRLEINLEKLMGIAYATDELVADSTQLEAVFSQAFAEEFAFTLDDEIINGDGVAKCLGIMNAACKVSVAKETSQAAATILSLNISKMWSRLWARSRPNAVWFINQDVEPQLDMLSVAVKNVAGSENVGGFGSPVYVPAGQVAGSPYGTLKGRPVIPIEQCATVGTVGDILLVDPTQYLLIDKGGVQGAQSMHVRFLYDEMTFRWTYRVNGKPIWKAALTPAKGTNTLSPFVSLDTRS